MNIVDIVILLVLVLGVIAGFRQGFIMEMAIIVGAIVALAVAKLEYGVVRALLATVFPRSTWLTAGSYLIVFLIVWSIIVTIARKLRTVVRLLFLGWADRLAGAVVGLLQGALVAELLLYVGQRVANTSLHHAIAHSRLGSSFTHVIPYVTGLFPHVVR